MTSRSECSPQCVARAALILSVPATAFGAAPWLVDAWVLPKLFTLRLLLTAAAVIGATSRALPRVGGPVLSATSLVIAVNMVASAISPAPLLGLRGAYQSSGGVLALVDGLLVLALAMALIRTRRQREALGAVVAATAAVSAIVGLAQHLGLAGVLWQVAPDSGHQALAHRAFGLMASPSFLGLYLAMAMPLALQAATAAESPRLRHLGSLTAPMIAVGLILTYSRAAWLAAAVATAIALRWVVPARSRRLAVSVVACGIAAGACLASGAGGPSAWDRVATVARPAEGSAAVRRRLWQGTWSMIRIRPVIGHGPDTFRYVFPRFAPSDSTDDERRNPSAHNEALDVLAETGCCGLAVVIALWLAVGAAATCAVRTWPTEGDTSSAPAWIALVVAWLVGVQFGFASTPVRVLWWMAAGVLSAAWPVAPHARVLGGRCWTAIAVAALLLFSFTVSRLVAEEAFSRGQSKLAAGELLAAAAALQVAARWDPTCDLYLVSLGQAVEAKGEDPVPFYQAAIRANPLQAGNTALLAQSLQSLGQWPNAGAIWRQTVALDPRWSDAHHALGVVCHRQGQDRQALEALHRALQLNPTVAEWWVDLGDVLAALARREGAIAAYGRALELAPGSAEAAAKLTSTAKSGPSVGAESQLGP